jgi:aminoglycoside phosphotransferase (APT) family kinase protein
VLRDLAGVRASPVAWLALAWLREHLPSQPETTLTHGDFRLGNLLWQGSAPVILDWEHAALGDPLADLAWLLMSAVEDQDMVMGLVTKRRLIELYEAESGRAVDRERLGWWEVLGTFVRLCMENRLVEFELQRERPDLRGLLWDAGSARTCTSLLGLMDRAEEGRRAVR